MSQNATINLTMHRRRKKIISHLHNNLRGYHYYSALAHEYVMHCDVLMLMYRVNNTNRMVDGTIDDSMISAEMIGNGMIGDRTVEFLFVF